MTARLEQSAALRLAIWQWLTANPVATMQDILEALPEYNAGTVRKNVQNMRKNFNIGIVRCRGSLCRYSATAIAPNTAAHSREKMRTSAITPEEKAARAAARKARKAAAKQATIDAARRAQDQDAPILSRYVHTPGQHRPSGGQGAVRARVYPNCHQNY